MFVTDTHPLIWYSAGHHSLLTPRVLKTFQKAEEGRSFIYVPSVVIWETGLLLKKGSVKLPNILSDWAGNILKHAGFEQTEFDLNMISTAIGYNFNGDPFDNLIVATAAELDLPLITKDTAITNSKLVEIYW